MKVSKKTARQVRLNHESGTGHSKEQMGNILYHYTDFLALEGIVVRSELRLNNVLNMNDSQEMQYLLLGIAKKMGERFRALGQLEYLDSVASQIAEHSEQLITYSAYASCFSKESDDAAQWERYGDIGRGVDIGFDREMLEKILPKEMELQDVYYDCEAKKDEFIQAFDEMIDQNEQEIIREGVTEEVRNFVVDILWKAWFASAAYKHPSFACENEVRLITWPELRGMKNIEPAYHVSRERIKKYYPINLKALCESAGVRYEDLFVNIKIGPESTQSPEILRDFLRYHKLDKLAGCVEVSDCPLRSALRK